MSKVIDQDGALLGVMHPLDTLGLKTVEAVVQTPVEAPSLVADALCIVESADTTPTATNVAGIDLSTLTGDQLTELLETSLQLDPVSDDESEPVVRAIVLYNPLDMTDRTVCDLVWTETKTLAEYLDGLPEDVDWSVSIGSKSIERAEWPRITLRVRETIVVGLTPNKAIMPIVMALALVVLVVLQQYYLIPLWAAALGSLAITVGGYLLSSMLADKPKDSNGLNKNTQSYGLDGAKNTSAETLSVPVVYGEMRLAGNKANFYVENNGDKINQTLFLQYIIGEGEIENVSQVRFNNQPIENYQNATWTWRAGIQNQLPMQWFSETISPYNVQADMVPQHFVYQTNNEVDRVRVDIVLPNGLYGVDKKSGNLRNHAVALRAIYSMINPDGTLGAPVQMENSGQWNVIDASSGSTDIPVSALRLTVLLPGANDQPTTPYTVALDYETIPGPVGGSWTTFVNETGVIPNEQIVDINGDVTYVAGSITRVFEMNSLPLSVYGIRINPSFPNAVIVKVEGYFATSLTFTESERGALRYSVTTPPLNRARYHFEFWRDTLHSSVAEIADDIVVSDINEIKDDLILYANTAYYGVQVELGADLNNEPNVTALVRGKRVKIYDRNGNVADYRWSNNPADIALDVMLNPRHRFAFNTTRIDFAMFDNWRQFCTTTNLPFNGVFDTVTNVWDALMDIMRVGRASPALQGLKWSVMIEAPSDPVMMFTQDNIIKGTFQSSWMGRKNRANLIEVQYADVNDDYKQHSVFALDESYIAQQEALVQSTITLRGITDGQQAFNEAVLQLNLNRYLTQSAVFDIYLQAMGIIPGDVVLVQHDMPQWGFSGRITDASIFDQVTIDSDVPFNGEADWRMLLVRGVAQLARGTVTSVSGRQIQISGLSSAQISSQDGPLVVYSGEDASIMNPVILDATQIEPVLRQYGIDRVLINSTDYRVIDWSVINGEIVIVSDTEFNIQAGASVELYKNDLMCEAQLLPATLNQRVLTINGWSTLYGAPRKGDIVMLGRVSRFKKPFRVLKITYKDDHTRTVSCLEYNETVYGPNATPTPNYSALGVTPYEVGNLRGKQIVMQLQGGAVAYQAQFKWDRPLNDPRGYNGAKVYLSKNFEPFTLTADLPNPISTFTTDAAINDTVRVKVVAYERSGEQANYQSAPIAAVTIGQSSQKPQLISGISASGGIRQISIKWTPVSTDYVKFVEVWENDHNDLSSAYLEWQGTANYFVRTNLNPKETRYFWLRTIAITGQVGDFSSPSVSATTSELIASDIAQGILDTSKFASTISPVGLFDGIPTSLSDTNGAKIALNTRDSKLYRWNGLAFTAAIQPVDVPGVALNSDVLALQHALTTTYLTTDQVNALVSSHTAGTLTADQLAQIKSATVSGLLVDARLNASSIVGQLTADQIASLGFDKISGKLAASNITDTDANGSQITGINISRVLGNLSATRIYDVDPNTGNTVPGVSAAKMLGTFSASSLPAIPTSKLTGSILASTTASLDLASTQIQGLLATTKLSGQITATQITDSAITTPKIAVGAVTASTIAVGAITAEKLAVGSPNNVIANSCFAYSMDGWEGWAITPVIGTAVEASWSLDGIGAGHFYAPALAPGAYVDAFYVGNNPQIGTRAYDISTPCTPGETWEAQIAIATATAFPGVVQLFLLFDNANGALIGAPSTNLQSIAAVSNGLTLDKWTPMITRSLAGATNRTCGMLIRFTNTTSTPIPVDFYLTRALLGTTVPNATSALPWTPGGVTSIGGGLIQTNAIVARNVIAGAITTSKLDAGAVTAEKLSIGSSTNVIWNPSCVITQDDWSVSPGASIGSNYPGFTVNGEGTGWCHTDATLGLQQALTVVWTPNGTFTPCVPGTWYEAQAKVGAHRCAGLVQMQFLCADYSVAGQDGSGPGNYNSQRLLSAGGNSLSQYSLGWAKGNAPNDAVYVRLVIYGINDGLGGYSNSHGADAGVSPFLFWTQASLGVSTPVPMAKSQPQLYAPGGVTEITGGVIKSDTIIGRHILAGSITAEKLSIGSGSNVIWNSCLTVSADGWRIGGYSTISGSILSVAGNSALTGWGSGSLGNHESIGTGYVDAVWAGAVGTEDFAVPCLPGSVWEAQVQVLTAGCTSVIHLFWFDASGTGCFSTYPESIGTNTGGPTDQGLGANTLDRYTKLTVIGTAPSNARFVTLCVRMQNSVAPGQFVLFTQAMLAQTVPNASQVSTWSPGGLTSIQGGLIASNAITSRVIAANQITARELAIGNSNNLISNSCCAVSTEGWAAAGGEGATVGIFDTCVSSYTQYATADGCGIVETSLPANSYVDVSSQLMAVQGSDWIEAQAMLLPVASNAFIYLEWFDANQNHSGYSTQSSGAPALPRPSGFLTLASFERQSLIAQAPLSAAFVKLILRFSSPQNTPVNGFALFTRAALGKTVAGATQVSDWSAGGITSIGAGLIKSSAVVARTIAAGAVTADKLTVAPSANVIGNPTCQVSAWGWLLIASASNPSLGSVIGDNYAPVDFALAGEGSGVLRASNLTPGQLIIAAWAPDNANGVPCSAGEWWEAQAYLAGHRCASHTCLTFWDDSGVQLGYADGNRVAGPPAGKSLQSYGFSWVKAQAPANATFVKCEIWAFNDNGADIPAGAPGQSPFLFFTRAVLGRSSSLPIAQGAQPQPYQIGGVTQITGGMIQTNAISARQIVANSITTDKIGANQVTASNIAAGAITTEKLSVGTPSNVIWNPCLKTNSTGWLPSGYGAAPELGPVAGSEFASVWLEPGDGTGYLRTSPWSPLSPGAFLDMSWLPQNNYATAEVGQCWCWQIRVIPLHCFAHLFLQFLDSNNSVIITIASTSIPPQGPPGGQMLGYYQKLFVRGIAPAGTARVAGVMRLEGYPGEQGNSAVGFFTQASLGLSNINATDMDPFVVGGATQITGGMIQAGSIRAIELDVNDVQANIITAGSITTSKLAAGAVTADTIAANAVTAAKLSAGAVIAQSIAAGAITTEKLAVGSATNVIWNSCFRINHDGWVFFGSGALAGYGAAANSSLGPAWSLQGAGTGYVSSAQLNPGDYMEGVWTPDGTGVPVIEGQWYVGQAMVAMHRCAAFVIVQFFDRYGGSISAQASDRTFFAQQPDGLSLYRYQSAWVCQQAPSGAAFAKLIVRGINDGGGDLSNGNSPYLFFTQASLGQCWTKVTSPPPFAEGGVTDLSGGAIKTNAIETRHLTAGAITTEKLAIGSGNIIWNGCCHNNVDGWSIGGYGGIEALNQYILKDAAFNLSPSYALRGFGTGEAVWNNDANWVNGQGFYGAWAPDGIQSMPVFPERNYQAAALLQPNRCSGRVDIIFLDGAGNYVGEINGNVIGDLEAQGGGGAEYNYQRSAAIGLAPAAAITCYMRWISLDGGYNRPYMFFTKAMLSEAPQNAYQVGDWVPGGVTNISGGVIQTNSIEARNMAANSISSDSIIANSVIFGKIAAGAVRATEIYSGQIRADHLAADFALIGTAQIGDATIENANIKNLTIGGAKLGLNSVTNGGASTNSSRVNLSGVQGWVNMAGASASLDTTAGRISITISCKNDYDNSSPTIYVNDNTSSDGG